VTSLAVLQAGDPQRVGPYVLLGRLGSGGMGRVYLARSPGGRQVAVKVIRPQLAEDAGFRARFAREVAAARKVGGLFTAQVVDADLDGPVPWLVTAYVPGAPLSEAVEQEGPLPTATVLALAAGLAEGLNAIHAAGVIHRDLKPSNVLLAPDGPRIIDFGISSAAGATSLTGTGLMIGSPGFMSPEQAEGMTVRPSSDIFSLAGVLTFASRGEGPFGTGDTAALLYRVVHGTPNLDQIPDRIRPLITRCLSRDPGARPTAAEFLTDLTEVYPSAADLADWLPARILELSAQRADEAGAHPPTTAGSTAAGAGAAGMAGSVTDGERVADEEPGIGGSAWPEPTQTSVAQTPPPATPGPQAYQGPVGHVGYQPPAGYPEPRGYLGGQAAAGGRQAPGAVPQAPAPLPYPAQPSYPGQQRPQDNQWYTPGMPQVTQRRRPRWPWVAGAAAVCVAVIVALVVGLGGSGHSAAQPGHRPSPRPTPTTPTATPTVGNLQLAQLQVGDCLTGANMELNTSNPWPKLTSAVPCSQSHTAEVFFADNTFWPKSSAFPGASAITKAGDAACNNAFRSYVGIAYSKSIYTWTNIIPDASTWPSGDRGLHCVAYYATPRHPAGSSLSGSIKGSRK
jgi:serine/threonine protein kinase